MHYSLAYTRPTLASSGMPSYWQPSTPGIAPCRHSRAQIVLQGNQMKMNGGGGARQMMHWKREKVKKENTSLTSLATPHFDPKMTLAIQTKPGLI